jgi:hypothetical protein
MAPLPPFIRPHLNLPSSSNDYCSSTSSLPQLITFAAEHNPHHTFALQLRASEPLRCELSFAQLRRMVERASAWLVSSGTTMGRERREEKVGCVAILKLASDVGLFVYLSALLVQVGLIFSSLPFSLHKDNKRPSSLPPPLCPPQSHINLTHNQRIINLKQPPPLCSYPPKHPSTPIKHFPFFLQPLPASSQLLPTLLSSSQVPPHLTPLDSQFHLHTKTISPQISTHSYSMHQGRLATQSRYTTPTRSCSSSRLRIVLRRR